METIRQYITENKIKQLKKYHEKNINSTQTILNELKHVWDIFFQKEILLGVFSNIERILSIYELTKKDILNDNKNINIFLKHSLDIEWRMFFINCTKIINNSGCDTLNKYVNILNLFDLCGDIDITNLSIENIKNIRNDKVAHSVCKKDILYNMSIDDLTEFKNKLYSFITKIDNIIAENTTKVQNHISLTGSFKYDIFEYLIKHNNKYLELYKYLNKNNECTIKIHNGEIQIIK